MRKIIKIPLIIIGVYLSIGLILFALNGFKHPEIIFYYGYTWIMLLIMIIRCVFLKDFSGACDQMGF